MSAIPFQRQITNTSDLRGEFAIKAQTCGLHIDCISDGNFNSEIAIIAEAPGEREAALKIPLCGGSGSMLWTKLRGQKVPFTRNDFYITNVVKRQVSFDRDDRKALVSKQELSMWEELLLWELSQLPNLKLIVALGNFSLKALTGHEGIKSWRGSVLDVDIPQERNQSPRRVKLLATFNPALVLRDPTTELIFNFDLGRIRKIVDGKWKPHPIDTFINPSFNEARDFIRDLRDVGGPVAHDIEIMGGETACVGLSNNSHSAMCINFRTRKEHRYSVEEEIILRRDLQDLYQDPNIRLIGQNNMFDSSWLWFKDKIKVQPIWLDTMLAHHCLYPQMPHNLGYICTQYTTHPYYKDEKDLWREKGDEDDYWRYNCKDAAITFHAAKGLHRELVAQGLDEFFFQHVMRLQPHLIRMVVGGVKVDVDYKTNLRETLKEDLKRYQDEFNAAVHKALNDDTVFINPNSPAQLSDLLFNRLGLIGRGTKTDDENRKRMYKDPRTSDDARAMLDKLDKYKEEQKFYSTYANTGIDDDGRMRCEYKQTGVVNAPGRLSSSKVLWGHIDPQTGEFVQHGTNLQNQPKRAYPMYIADKGGTFFNGVDMTEYEDYTFIYFDGSQAEARFVGWDAEIPLWIEQFERARLDGSYDAHRALASEMFKIPYEEVPTDDEIDGVKTVRFTAKRCRHGLNYRMAPDRLASTTGLSLREATHAYNLYHELHPQLRVWWKKLMTEASKSRMLFNAFGRRLFIQGRLDDPSTLESVVAFRPQSTIGDKVSRVIYQAESHSKWPKEARIAMNVHDALIGIAPISKAKTALAIMKGYMEQPIPHKPHLPPLIIPADTAIAEPDETGTRRWSTLKKLKDLEAYPV